MPKFEIYRIDIPRTKPVKLSSPCPPEPRCGNQLSDHKLSVLKFGSSVLRNTEDYARAAHEIYRHTRAGEKVVAVVSALAGETDALFNLAESMGGSKNAGLVARLVRNGELESAALMGLALESAGIPVAVLDPHEMGLKAQGDALDANLVGLDAHRVLRHLETADVIVAPGFFGEGIDGPATLGRGGTDLTAVMFAHWLGASRARLIKDVDGVYSEDPRIDPDAQRLECVSYEDAARISRGLVQSKAICAAQEHDLTIEVAAVGKGYATKIGREQRRVGLARSAAPLRVAVLGHGAVGAGVCQHLLAHPNRFILNPVLVRDPVQHDAEARSGLTFTHQAEESFADDPDIVVELMGGLNLARSLSQTALRNGAHLVTANKAIMAQDFALLHELASRNKRALKYTAAVGGGAPILETLDRLSAHAGIMAVDGVMNGTCNYIFGQLQRGERLEDAIKRAQDAGFAEADPSTDIDGHDAADKLSIIIRHAFGIAIEPRAISRQSLNDLSPGRIRAVAEQGLVLKQIGSCSASRDGSIRASVEIRALPVSHRLASLKEEANGFIIHLPQGEVSVFGKGAGRWPTAHAVFADIMDIQRLAVTRSYPQRANMCINDGPHVGDRYA
jgi:homoserine dehydrogenase